MPRCNKCNVFLPPGFVGEVVKVCVFCEREIKEITFVSEGKQNTVTKKELEKEYDYFLKKVRDKNEILKNAVQGNMIDVPKKLIIS